MLGNNHLGNIFAEVITIKTLFASAKPSAITDCRGEFRGLMLPCKHSSNLGAPKTSRLHIYTPRHPPHNMLPHKCTSYHDVPQVSNHTMLSPSKCPPILSCPSRLPHTMLPCSRNWWEERERGQIYEKPFGWQSKGEP